jgi:hypothetical protein
LALLFLLILIPLCSGCSWFTEYIYVHERFPIITKPEEPKLSVVTQEELSPLSEDVRGRVLTNIVAIRTHNKKLEKVIDTYNQKAKEHNEKNKKETSP